MKSALRLVRLVRTMSSRPAQSSTPSIATLALWPGAGMRRSVPLLAQTGARYGWVSASDSSPNRSTMSPASAWALSSFRRRPARSTASASWRPFSVWRGRRQRKAPLAEHNRQPRAGDARARARLDRVDQPRQRPVRAIRYRPGQNLLGHRQGALGFDRSWPRRDGFLQGFDAARHESAAPEPNRILPHPEGLGDLAAGPAQQGQQDRPRPVGLAAIPRVAQGDQPLPLLFVSHNRCFARHDPNLEADQTTGSRPTFVGQLRQICLAVLNSPWATQSRRQTARTMPRWAGAQANNNLVKRLVVLQARLQRVNGRDLVRRDGCDC